MRAFDSRIDNSPRQGFSQQALLARLEILRGARDSLADPEIRAEYNQGLAEDEADTLILDVPLTKVRAPSFSGQCLDSGAFIVVLFSIVLFRKR